MLLSAPCWAWVGFHLLVFLMLALDLGVFNRRVHAPSIRESALWSAVWIALSLAFNAVVFHFKGSVAGAEWFTGYVLEKSLSVDNLFVFVMLFGVFKVETRHQHRILYWGILGALVMRAAMILAGTALLNRFEWMMYIFGAFLVYTGIKMFFVEDSPTDPRDSRLVKWLQRVLPFDPGGGHQHFLVKKEGRHYLTPMLLVLLGLRSLYFLLARMMDRFHRLKLGLAVILSFVGVKMCLDHWLHIPIYLSLLFIGAVLAGCIIASLAQGPKTSDNS